MSRSLSRFGLVFLPILLVVGLLVMSTMIYVVDEREMAVVLQFGNPVAERKEPGMYFKLPVIQRVRKLPRTKQFWGDSRMELLPDLPTIDDKKIEVIPWAIWRINEPTAFVTRLATMESAEQRVAQYVRGAIRDKVTQYELAELVRSSDREMTTSAGLDDLDQGTGVEVDGVDQADAGEATTRKVRIPIQHGRLRILKEIKDEARRRLSQDSKGGAAARGIELVDLGISQIDFVDSVRRKTFDRWIAEREAISARNVNEGERLKQGIINRATADAQRIEGEGQQKANEIRGEVDAEVIRRYAEAISEAGEFYTLVRTLEAYKAAINRDTRLILTTDSEFLRLLKRLNPPGPVSPPSTPAPAATVGSGE